MLLGRKFEDTTNDVSFERNEGRFRVNISRTISGITITFRNIPSMIPEATEISLPSSLLEVTK